MRKILSIILFSLIFAASVFATHITISSTVRHTWTFGGATAQVRIYATKTVVTSDLVTITGGTSSGWYKTVSCTVAGADLTCPSFTIDSTTDSSDPTVRYVADVYDSNSKLRGRFINEAFRVPTSL